MVRENLLTEREKAVMELVIIGFSNKKIADTLCLAEQTINNYIQTIYNKYYIEADGDYNRRVRAAYIFNKNKRLELGYKAINKSKELQDAIEKFAFWLEGEE